MEKKKIPCRVCGKLFVPCAFCQSHQGTFRWRNFACSIECAKEYIEKATKYRQSTREKIEETTHTLKEENTEDLTKKKRGHRKKVRPTDETMQIEKTEIVNDEG